MKTEKQRVSGLQPPSKVAITWQQWQNGVATLKPGVTILQFQDALESGQWYWDDECFCDDGPEITVYGNEEEDFPILGWIDNITGQDEDFSFSVLGQLDSFTRRGTI